MPQSSKYFLFFIFKIKYIIILPALGAFIALFNIISKCSLDIDLYSTYNVYAKFKNKDSQVKILKYLQLLYNIDKIWYYLIDYIIIGG